MIFDVSKEALSLTKTEQRIQEYMELNKEEVLFLSIGQLAKKLEVSEATISRFAKHVGYTDYKSLKQKIMEQQRLEGPALKLAGSLAGEHGFQLQDYFLKQQTYLQKTLEFLSLDSFAEGVNSVLNAERIYIHGKNASKTLSELLFYRLRRIGLPVVLLPTGGNEILEGLAHITERDLVIMFSFSKNSYEGNLILDLKKKLCFRVIGFTGRIYGEVEDKDYIPLYVYRGEDKEYHSMTTAVTLVDSFILAISEKLDGKGLQKLKHLHELKMLYGQNRL